LDKDLITLVLPKLPAILIILVIEHIAIAKSFGRTFNYTVVPSQEILAQGASNLFGTFVGGYVCTGSFGASAVLSKAGVRTPFAGLFSALILILALYALTAVFYYIPMAALAGLIIHAVADLPTPPKSLHKYWKLSPPEFVIWWIGVLIAIFVSLEISIYVTICISLALMLIRLSRAQGRFLGQTRVYHYHTPSPKDSDSDLASGSTAADPHLGPFPEHRESAYNHDQPRNIDLPLDHHDASNPEVTISAPHPGVFIYRFPSGFNYTNQAQHIHHLVDYIKNRTRPGTAPSSGNVIRLWSDSTPLTSPDEQTSLPRLRAVVLDCTAVDIIDITSVQGLVDARRSLDRHACRGRNGDGRCVQWHFAGLCNRWARRALAVAGFGAPAGQIERMEVEGGSEENPLAGWKPVYMVTSATGGRGGGKEVGREGGGEGRAQGLLPVHGVDRPFFHVDLMEAVDAAVREARRVEACREGAERKVVKEGGGREV
jgi:sodium-independent sulfate anion transporter 11